MTERQHGGARRPAGDGTSGGTASRRPWRQRPRAVAAGAGVALVALSLGTFTAANAAGRSGHGTGRSQAAERTTASAAGTTATRPTAGTSTTTAGGTSATTSTAAGSTTAADAATSTTTAGSGGTDQRIAVPAYVPTDDTASWASLTTGEAGVLVANPDSGPGTAVDTAWQADIAAAHAAGTTVIGYVDTGYFGHSTDTRTTDTGESTEAAWTAQAEADIATWYDLYGDDLGGVFLDDGLNTCGTDDAYVDLYAALDAYTRTLDADALTVMNPGTSTDECFSGATDVIVTFEGPGADYLTTGPADWQADADPASIWNIVYGVDEDDLDAVLERSRAVGAGYVYATPDGLPNPYDTAPTGDYWAAEVAGLGTVG